MRYYVKTLSGEKGPYELEEIADSLRNGRLAPDTLLRPEDSKKTVSIAEVVPHDGTMGSSGGRRRRAAGDVYAPPEEDDSPASMAINQGNFAQGFVFGFFCGCFALIYSLVSDKMGSETQRGVRIGFVVQLVLGVVIRVLAMASATR